MGSEKTKRKEILSNSNKTCQLHLVEPYSLTDQMLEEKAKINNSRNLPLMQDLQDDRGNRSISIATSHTRNNSRDSSPYKRRRNQSDVRDKHDLEAYSAHSSQKNTISIPSLLTCGIDGCNQIALGGRCEFRVCCSTGCNKVLCKEHTAKPENPDEVGLINKVCVEC